jgi:hypothetical protein
MKKSLLPTVLAIRDTILQTDPFNLPIESMAHPKSTIDGKIAALDRQIKLHVLKCILAPSNSAVNGWLRELTAWYTYIGSLKTKTKTGRVSWQTLMDGGLCWLNKDEIGYYLDALEEYTPADQRKTVGDQQFLVKRYFQKFSHTLDTMASFIVEKERKAIEVNEQLRNLLT